MESDKDVGAVLTNNLAREGRGMMREGGGMKEI